MPKDATPRKPQAFQPEDRAQGGSHSQPDAQSPMKSDAAAENPEQVFAGECGDPIWEGRRPAEARPPHQASSARRSTPAASISWTVATGSCPGETIG